MDRLFPAPSRREIYLDVLYLDFFEHVDSPKDWRNLGSVRSDDGVRADPTTSAPLYQASFLQAWLFFGLISEFFKAHVSPSRFLASGPMGARLVSIDPAELAGEVDKLGNHVRSLAADRRGDFLQCSEEILNLASEEVEHYDIVRPLPSAEEWELDQLAKVILSIRLLICYFRLTLALFPWSSPKDYLRSWSTWTIDLPSYIRNCLKSNATNRTRNNLPEAANDGGRDTLSMLLLLGRFVRNGWCSVRARQMFMSYDLLILNYLSQLKRVNDQEVCHRNCEKQEHCVAYDLPDFRLFRYETQHIEGCDCEQGSVDLNQLIAIVNRGGIPLVSIDPETPDLQMTLEEHDGVGKYVAISHVWSDGLGNPHSNSLPLCQLRRITQLLLAVHRKEKSQMSILERWATRWVSAALGNLISRKTPRLYFWMDTLCIPSRRGTGSIEYGKDLKLKAMKMITPIIQGADQTLVLDTDLDCMTECVEDWRSEEHDEEMVARLLASKWMQRSWTFEEGALARDCYFKVAGEGLERLSDLEKPRLYDRYSMVSSIEISLHLQYPLKWLLAGPLNERRKQASRPGASMAQRRKFAKSRVSQLVEAWNGLLERSATKAEDPPIIFANILDFNVNTIGRLDPEQRLPSVIKSCDDIPASLLFNAKHRPKRGGYDAWIPSQIAGNRLTQSAILRKGLSQNGLVLDRTTCERDSFHVLRSEIMVPFDELAFEINNEDDKSKYIVESTLPDRARNDAGVEGSFSATCIMIDYSTGTRDRNGYTARGAIFSLRDRDRADGYESKEILIAYERPVYIWSEQQWLHVKQRERPAMTVFRVENIEGDQRVTLEQNCSDWDTTYTRRSLLPPKSYEPKKKVVIASIILGKFLIFPLIVLGLEWACRSTFRETETFKCGANRHSSHIPIAGFITIAVLAIMKWARKRAYRSWLRSFDDEWDPKAHVSLTRRVTESTLSLTQILRRRQWIDRGSAETEL
ncbi:MAG: hypothetical protein M1831_001243 [Alyxoria varia]|nr:MAG: hypothetical protein M1831_001243 [Alyxoria varia]